MRLTAPRSLTLSALVCAALLLPQGVAAAAAPEPAAHRAIYTLTLGKAKGDVASASGTMAYEVLDACDGWATRQRLDMTITNRDGQDIKMVSDYTTWEAKDGLRLRFQTKQTTETAVTSEVSGDASLPSPGGAGTVRYTLPADTSQELPAGTLFPMAHTEAIIAAAAGGKKFLALPLFDGTSPDGAQNSSVAITSWGGPQPDATKWPDLGKLPSGRVHVAFFDRKETSQQPDYEVGMRYWTNGVADDLAMDFGDFLMDGKLTEFKLQPPGC